MNIKYYRKPLITPGPYLKIAEVNDNFCEFIKGKGKSSIITGWALPLLKKYLKIPSKCPILPVSQAKMVELLSLIDLHFTG